MEKCPQTSNSGLAWESLLGRRSPSPSGLTDSASASEQDTQERSLYCTFPALHQNDGRIPHSPNRCYGVGINSLGMAALQNNRRAWCQEPSTFAGNYLECLSQSWQKGTSKARLQGETLNSAWTGPEGLPALDSAWCPCQGCRCEQHSPGTIRW